MLNASRQNPRKPKKEEGKVNKNKEEEHGNESKGGRVIMSLESQELRTVTVDVTGSGKVHPRQITAFPSKVIDHVLFFYTC
jgi:hypothetical protein